jgi:acetyl-CoA carboxylase biotin carboxyl carrier protein
MSKRPPESDVAFIQALAELLRENDLTEIEVNRAYGDEDVLSVRVSRQAPVQPQVVVAPPSYAAAPPAPQPQGGGGGALDPAEDPGVVASPMVGTAYLQGEPDSEPFVKLGDTVSEGQTILIIEAMKTMNQIPAPRAGRIKRILVEDGSPVEFGAPLIILE